jgi:hypothetical protein
MMITRIVYYDVIQCNAMQCNAYVQYMRATYYSHIDP